MSPPLTATPQPPVAPAAGAEAKPDLPQHYLAFKQRRYFTCLDGLRALSILAVIWHHAAAPAFGSRVPLLHEGNRGVNLFFVISAFLISTLLLRAKARGTLNVPRFWARRALRILPLYYGMLAVYALLVFAVEHDVAARQGFFAHIPYFATFTSNWFVDLDSPRVIFYFAWSLAAEEQFYLCWPWIERALGKLWPAVVALGALVVTQAAGLMYLHADRQGLALRIVSSVPSAILLGVVLAHVLDRPWGFRWAMRIAGRRGSAIGAMAVVLAVLSVERRVGFFGELLVAIALTLLVASCVVREDNDLAAFLRWPSVAWIGTISYGVYLMHVLCLRAVRGALARVHLESPLIVFAATVVLSIGVASLSYLTYERFFLRLKERWFGEKPTVRHADILGTAAPTLGTLRPELGAQGAQLRTPS
ncbi:MAG TPA: acyltransferase [Opitutaceae bacterium]|nr:acyltransferase [Opitutaceae bacterium]